MENYVISFGRAMVFLLSLIIRHISAYYFDRSYVFTQPRKSKRFCGNANNIWECKIYINFGIFQVEDMEDYFLYTHKTKRYAHKRFNCSFPLVDVLKRGDQHNIGWSNITHDVHCK